MTRLLSCILVATVVFTACSSDDDDGRAALSTTTTTTSRTESCAPAAGYTPGTTTHTIEVDGKTREFLVHLPPEPAAGMPLVVDFHGAGSDMTQQSVYSGFDPVADREGFVVATPNGVDAAIRQWHFIGRTEDAAFARALVGELVDNACVDRARAYAVGISSGSAMSASLACQASDVFAGFGLVAGDFYNEGFCGAAEARPIVIFHGTADAVVPYAGGSVATSGVGVQPAEEVAQQWATHNGCTGEPRETTVGSEVVRLDWTGCTAPVVMFRIVGGGHTWPGAAVAVDRLGPTTGQVSATAEMWNAFREPR